MKKIESMPGGRFIVTVFTIAFAVILLCGIMLL